uniref:TSA: Wollemia nobilis Ref_Wollemi_Transcript_1688_1227 transcribed RNA sequence n=1 Tax=Wollemia nobilis TaxID=56998 RepID=A0A0C9SAW0_9CONI
MALKSIQLTHVKYEERDRLGYFLAWISLLPVFISLGGFVTHFIFRRELQAMFFFMGMLISEFLNQLTKKSVQQARPETCLALEMCDSHGWPSSHSQFMMFFAVYLNLLAYKGIGLSGKGSRILVGTLGWVLAFLTMYSRVYLGYHTVEQVFAGGTLGLFLGILWFWFVNSVLVHIFPMLESTPFCEYFCIKDTSHIPDVFYFEYKNARAARKAMMDAKNEKEE